MSTLADVAFGDCPGRWPLPDATTPLELWQRAVATGGQGRYASATSDLDTLLRTPSLGSLASLAHSTRASFLRQLGGHVSARSWDGYAWALAGSDAEARADALIGLAADALGVGRFAASARLLRRAGELVGDDVPARSKVRLAWVTAELAMVTGDGFAAVGHARRAVAASESTSSVRHAVKSQVVLAAALCCAGEPRRIPPRRRRRACRGAAARLGAAELGFGLPTRRRGQFGVLAGRGRCRSR